MLVKVEMIKKWTFWDNGTTVINAQWLNRSTIIKTMEITELAKKMYFKIENWNPAEKSRKFIKQILMTFFCR